MGHLPIRLVCSGCGFEAPAGEPPPWRCPHAGRDDDVDHVLRRHLDPGDLGPREEVEALFDDPEPNPFVQYRRLLQSYQEARAGGLTDGDDVALVERLDQAVAVVDGRGFRRTPFRPDAGLARSLGVEKLWIKDETGNVAGSHKGRHLMGVALWLEVARRLEGGAKGEEPRLAIASCGNAALAAAVVARAAGRPLEVFIPPWADPAVVARLSELGARLTRCPRQTGITGDPCFHRFRQAVKAGALPFTCQGPENGLVIEGGQTLAWEMVSTLRREGASLDRLFVQVGGGALATACVQGLAEARLLGLLPRLPRIHAVQTLASPLARAYDRLVARILERFRRQAEEGEPPPETPAGRADWLRERVPAALVEAELGYAASHRSRFMWPWEEEPRSLATGILDDETYDWLAVLRGMIETGGFPLQVPEAALAEAHGLAREVTGIAVDPTGTAGLAGALQLARAGGLAPNEKVAVLFTGALREPG